MGTQGWGWGTYPALRVVERVTVSCRRFYGPARMLNENLGHPDFTASLLFSLIVFITPLGMPGAP